MGGGGGVPDFYTVQPSRRQPGKWEVLYFKSQGTAVPKKLGRVSSPRAGRPVAQRHENQKGRESMTTKRARKRAIRRYIQEGIVRETRRRRATEAPSAVDRVKFVAKDLRDVREGSIPGQRKLGYASTGLQTLAQMTGDRTVAKFATQLRGAATEMGKIDKIVENALVYLNRAKFK